MKKHIIRVTLYLSFLFSGYGFAVLYPGDNTNNTSTLTGSWYADVMKKTAEGLKVVKPDKALLSAFTVRPSDDFSLNYGTDDHVTVFRFGAANE